ncbi:ATP-binding cassette domain-containing protein, partial [Conchiformibius steedae]
MISVENVSHRYPAAAAPALEQVSLHIAAGTVLGLLGPNGAGKTTLMSLMAGLQPVQSGLIT